MSVQEEIINKTPEEKREEIKKQQLSKLEENLKKMKTLQRMRFSIEEKKIIDDVSNWYLPEGNFKEGFCFCSEGAKKFNDEEAFLKFSHVLKASLVIRDLEKQIRALIEDSEEDYFAFKKAIYDDFFIKFKMNIEDGKREQKIFRGSVINGVKDKFWSFRRVSSSVPKLTELNLTRPDFIKIFQNNYIKSGLVLVVAETGNGKTTTCSSIIKYLCEERGLFALTVEDPPELPLNGYHKNGVCIQTEVKQNGFADAIRNAMRSYPATNGSILYVGEIRDQETAKELIKASANGHLVFATLHGDDIITGIKRLIDMSANGENGDDIRSMLANSIRMVVYQELKDTGYKTIEGKTIKELDVEFLLFNGVTSPQGNLVKSNKIDSLNESIQNQKIIMEKQGVEALLNKVFVE